MTMPSTAETLSPRSFRLHCVEAMVRPERHAPSCRSGSVDWRRGTVRPTSEDRPQAAGSDLLRSFPRASDRSSFLGTFGGTPLPDAGLVDLAVAAVVEAVADLVRRGALRLEAAVKRRSPS